MLFKVVILFIASAIIGGCSKNLDEVRATQVLQEMVDKLCASSMDWVPLTYTTEWDNPPCDRVIIGQFFPIDDHKVEVKVKYYHRCSRLVIITVVFRRATNGRWMMYGIRDVTDAGHNLVGKGLNKYWKEFFDAQYGNGLVIN